MKYGAYVAAFFAGLAIGVHAFRASETSCCQRVAFGARDKLAGLTGAAAPLTAGALDALGLTGLFPGLLDAAGVPKDA